MDRDEALTLLRGGREGIAKWNHHRSSGEEVPDLHGADLSGANLSGADLSKANLLEADLSGVNLTGANLSGADLNWADLSWAGLGGANLTGANLDGANLNWAGLRAADLIRADLSEAHLNGADLNGADLSGADLNGADLRAADLSRADLNGADLGATDLIGTNLGGANLTGANLTGADLTGANLLEADLSRVRCSGTLFADVDLSRVKGLDLVEHLGPSEVSVSTLVRSRGQIPEAFLRGCGVPDLLIVNLPALIGALEPIQFYSCFISYSTKDEEFAKRLHARMVQETLRVWFAPEDIQGGKKINEQIDQAIRLYDKLLLVLSPHSINSKWVQDEIRRARKAEVKEGQRKLFPIRLMDFDVIRDWECFDADSGKDLGVEIREYFIPDFTNWKDHDSFEAGFARLLEDLKKADGSTAK